MPDYLDDYNTFTAYLLKSEWVTEENKESVQCALAAFENSQRRRGAEAARVAMDKAARKVW